jgi:diamine N-acetyltransferase
MTPTAAELPPVQIRAATADDNERLAEFGAAMFAETFGPDNTPENLAAYLASTYGPDKQAAELAEPNSIYLLAEAAGEVVGYAWLKAEPAPEAVRAQRPLELVRFYTARAWHGKGLAGTLMQACLSAAEWAGADALWLSVWQRNPRAVAFYRKWGFETAGTLVFQVGDDPQTDWLMVRVVP